MYKRATEYIQSKTALRPQIGVILGTGLSTITEEIEDAVVIPFQEIPGFPVSAVHPGNLVIGRLDKKPIACMQGRVHFYEGYSMQELAVPVQTLCALGVSTLLLTNASGAICEEYFPGEIVAICDHIKFDLRSPLRGKNPDALGERFFDMTDAYTPKLRAIAKTAAEELGIALPEGVYAYTGGPQFETPAEIRMLRILGADLVGMSTVPEVISAVHCGMKILALSCVTNMAAGIENGGLNKAVIATAEKDGTKAMKRLLKKVVEKL